MSQQTQAIFFFFFFFGSSVDVGEQIAEGEVREKEKRRWKLERPIFKTNKSQIPSDSKR